MTHFFYLGDMTPFYVTWLIHSCDMTRSYVWHDSFIHATWLIRSRDTRIGAFWLCATWLIHMRRVSCSFVWHDSFIVTHVNESCHTCKCVMSHMWMSHVTHVNVSCHVMSHMTSFTHVNVSCHTCEWVMSHMWMRHVTQADHTHTHVHTHTYTHTRMQMVAEVEMSAKDALDYQRFVAGRRGLLL